MARSRHAVQPGPTPVYPAALASPPPDSGAQSWWKLARAYAGHALIVIGVLAALAGVMLWLAWKPAPGRVEVIVPTPAPLRVHVAGGVVSPGVYELQRGARLEDAIRVAGGLGTAADWATLNLARQLVDGERVDVPVKPAAGSAAEISGAPSDPGLVDLNTASAYELERLPEIGPVMAAEIAAWVASNGPVIRVDELLSVQGIGPKTVEAIRPFVVQK